MRCRSIYKSAGSPCASRTMCVDQSLSNNVLLIMKILSDSVIGVAHVSNLSNSLANHFPKLARSYNPATSPRSNVRCAVAGLEHVLDPEFNVARVLLKTERVTQHHRRGRDRAARIRCAVARDVRRGAMHRLIKSDFTADRGRSQHPQRTGDDRGFV